MQNSLITFRHLVQEASLARSSEERAEKIVSGVKEAMNVAVCSLYVRNETGMLKLVATDGLNQESVGRISLNLGEGLVGTIAVSRGVLNLESAKTHPAFRYFPEAGEENLEAFLGAPIVHAGELFGVLVVEEDTQRKFTEEEESFLVTAATHLGALNPVDFRSQFDPKKRGKGNRVSPTSRLGGVVASPGIGIGRVLLVTADSDLMQVGESRCTDRDRELGLFREAVSETLEELGKSREQLNDDLPRDVSDVFSVYELMLTGNDFTGEVEQRIGGGLSAASSLRIVVEDYASRFENMEDDYFRARSDDIRILGGKIYHHMCDTVRQELPEDEDVVIVGGLVSVADIAAFPPDRVKGIVCASGSVLSHTALLAKALGIPAVMGVGRILEANKGDSAVVDGYRGHVIISPSTAVIAEYRSLIGRETSLVETLGELQQLPAETPDGFRVRLFANTGLLADISPGLANGAEGVGLYRSEIPFLIRESFPSEDVQVGVYRTVLEAYEGMPVCMRTLDIGGDKPLPYFPFHEENPALGWRGIRFTLDNSAVFLTQIRALLRASEGLDNLNVMLPMVHSVGEVEAFIELLDLALSQLAEEAVTVTRPRIGIMAEVPVVGAILPHVKDIIQFVSIGSNDLSQYSLAVDRNNASVSPLFDHLHPGVIRLIDGIVREAFRLNLDVSVCGDIASDPCGAVLLLGMGVSTLSMPAFSIPRIKWLLRSIRREDATEILSRAFDSRDSAEIRSSLQSFIREAGLSALIDPASSTPGAERN